MWVWIRDRLRDPEARHNDWVYRYEWHRTPEEVLRTCQTSEWELVSATYAPDSDGSWGYLAFLRRPMEHGL